MMKPDQKTALFLKPVRLRQRWSPLEAFHITKGPRGVDYAREQLEPAVVEKYFGFLPSVARQALVALGDEALKQSIAELTRTHARQKAGTSLTAYIDRSFIRQVHQFFCQLLPHTAELRWYHQTVNPTTGNHLTGGCVLVDLVPTVSFKVCREEDGALSLQVFIRLGDTVRPLADFHREYFFLQLEREYFLLTMPDYLTLQWLSANDPSAYAHDAPGFSEHVLKRLESERYEIEMGSLLNRQVVEVDPVNAIYLSEISGSFLMLTPRWNYDGFWVEGPWQHSEEFTRNGEVYVVKRNREKEQVFHDQLQSLHPNFSRQLNGVFNLPFAEAKKKHWFLKVYHRLLEENVELLGMEMLRHFRYSPFAPETEVRLIRTVGSNLHLHMNLRFGKEDVPLFELQKLLLAGVKSLLLKDHSIAVLTEEWLAQYSAIIKHGRIVKNEVVVPQWILLGLERVRGDGRPAGEEMVSGSSVGDMVGESVKGTGNGSVGAMGNGSPAGVGNGSGYGSDFGADAARRAIDSAWWKRWQQWQQSEEALVPVPSIVKAHLRPYQQKGFEWICLLSEIGAGACLADDMGLGKTLQTICFIAHRLGAPGADLPSETLHPSGATRRVKSPALIVCPASLMHNWRLELEKFAPSLKSYVYHGNTRNMQAFADSGSAVLITSYGTLRSDFDQLQVVHWDTAVLDESHTIKNPSAQVTRAVYQLQAGAKIALSGTPVMNNTFDLYAQLQFLVPGLFGGAEFFRKEYANPIDREHSEEKIKALQQLTAPFVLRRTKQQVATDLPPKTEQVLWCEMGPEQKALYEETRGQIRDSLFLNIRNEGLGKSKLSILQGMQKLRQICAAPQLLKDGGDSGDGLAGMASSRAGMSSVKAEVLLEELQYNLRTNKVLVFSQFKGMLRLLGDACQRAGLSYYHFDGETPPARRSELVAQFQEPGNEVNIFLISLKAGNTGLTLTAADYVFLVDPWWNTAVQQQAIDRAYRIGQTKNVFAYQMICKDSIEEKIVELQQRKRSLSDALITEDEGFIKQLSEDDLRYLFS
ncbi:DEAD/DEAH box helicase [Flavihumibacter stibioxidans]|uniref:DEAD/DEAH box helicase n=1 Tax=Flavihumibacter stibioxidans TaxID=1834163 RepID=A0ABR7MCF4_9BACT|nr:DEAD/DEAH box helicase [Flavihumibacter stibioxidans]MBC6492705.1 hypothetical protein [Flavihumibacter stibioxidans]